MYILLQRLLVAQEHEAGEPANKDVGDRVRGDLVDSRLFLDSPLGGAVFQINVVER